MGRMGIIFPMALIIPIAPSKGNPTRPVRPVRAAGSGCLTSEVSASKTGRAALRRTRSFLPTNSRIARVPASPSRGVARRENAGVAAGPVGEARGDVLEEDPHGLLVAQQPQGPAAGVDEAHRRADAEAARFLGLIKFPSLLTLGEYHSLLENWLLRASRAGHRTLCRLHAALPRHD